MEQNGSDKIVIIGGAGCIGVALYQLLKTRYKDIYIFDNLSSNNSGNVKIFDHFYYIDIRDKEKLKLALEKINPAYIYNLSAHFANQNSVDFPYEDATVNILGQINILECARNLKNLRKIVYASSSCVYGNNLEMDELEHCEPYETPYAINKYAIELYMKYYAKQFLLPCISVRIFNTYGPYELPGKYRNVIPNFIKSALKNENLKITGTGMETRDFTYAEDTARCLFCACESQFSDGSVFNAGSGSDTKIIDLANNIILLCQSTSKIEFFHRRSWDDVEKRKSNIERTQELLGYEPKINLQSGLIKTINWHKTAGL